MFKTLLVILNISLLTSCAAVKTSGTDKEVINTYLQNVVYNKNYQKIFVAEDPLPGKESLEVYETALREKDLEPNHLRQIWHHELNPWPLDEKEIAILKNKILDEKAESWGGDDFNDLRIIIKDAKTIDSDFAVEYLLHGKNAALFLSKPLYSSNKQFVLFECTISDGFGNGPAIGSGVVVMKKEKGKWVQTALFNRAIYY